jgi:hypothetical protein
VHEADPALPPLDRKVRCDGSMPVCQNCVRSKRECHRKVFSLSWPRDKDRRAIIGLDSRKTQAERIQHHHFINTGFSQVEACSSSRMPGYNGLFILGLLDLKAKLIEHARKLGSDWRESHSLSISDPPFTLVSI